MRTKGIRRSRARSMALLGLLAGFSVACAQQAESPEQRARTTTERTSAAEAGYRFSQPDTAYQLPNNLDEISGLTPLDDGRLGAVQDEDGKLFVLNTVTGEVESEEQFAKDGDYEGVERVGDSVYVLRSDGALFEVADWKAEDLDAEKHETSVPKGCDAEGLAYDAAGGRLLIACKEQAGKGLRGKKAIYAFDLASRTLDEQPAFIVDVAAVTEQVHAGERAVNQRIRRLAGSAFDLSGFKPSGLAQHPRTGRLYLLSTRLNAVVVLEPDGRLRSTWRLPEPLEQPEGIAFLPDGTLYIASEATEGRAWLLKFTYQP